MENTKNIKEEIQDIIHNNPTGHDMFTVDQNNSVTVSRLFELAKSKGLDLIIEAHGFFYYDKNIDTSIENNSTFSSRRAEVESFTTRVYVKSCLATATQELTDDMIDQFETKFGSVDYEISYRFTEGFRLIEVNKSAIIIELECGS